MQLQALENAVQTEALQDGMEEMRKQAKPGELALMRTACHVAHSKKPTSQYTDIVKVQAINGTPEISEDGVYQGKGACLQFVDAISHVLTTELKVWHLAR